MKKSRKMAVLIVLIIASPISFANRMIYGTWNVLSYPNRVFFNGYRYDNDGYIVTFTDKEKPKYEVSKKIDRLTGKRIFSKNLDYIGNGKVVYLYLGGNKYLVLGCGGGG